MKAKVISGIVLTLLFFSILPWMFNIQLCKAEPNTIIVPDDYEKIQWAIGNATNGDEIFVRAGTYYENVVVDKTLTLVGENRSTTFIDGNGTGTIVQITANQVNLSGFTIQNGGSDVDEAGVYLSNSNKSTISDNKIASNTDLAIYISNSNNNTISHNIVAEIGYGIWLVRSENNTILENTAIGRVGGIRLIDSNRNEVIANNVSNCHYEGIYLIRSNGNILRLNNMTNNGINFGIQGTSLSHFVNDIDTSNKVDKKSLYYLVNQNNKQIPSDAGYVAAVNSTNITVKNLNLEKNCNGVLFVHANDSTVENVTISNCGSSSIKLYYSGSINIHSCILSNNYEGISLDHSSGNVINGITVTSDWSEHGVELNYSHDNIIMDNIISDNQFGVSIRYSDGNTITENVVSNNDDGIIQEHSWDNIISDNVVTSNDGYGVSLVYSSNNTVIRNALSHNREGINIGESEDNVVGNNTVTSNESGIMLAFSNGNMISGNTFSNNTYGIYGGWSSGNTIYHNNFIDNIEQVDSPSSTNIWDDGYPSGGNYWNDYNGTDLFNGPYQNVSGSDGIGDSAYIIDGSNRDHYPLMNPWGAPPPLATVDIDPDNLNLKSNGRWITCYIELPEGYDVNQINRTTILLNDTIPIDSFWIDKPLESVIGDYDNDTIPDLMVKFSRAAVIDYYTNQNITNENITLTVTGELYDGTSFEGNDMIRVKMPDAAIAKMSSEANSDNEKILVIPEFSSLLILPLFMAATLLAFIIYRKKQ